MFRFNRNIYKFISVNYCTKVVDKKKSYSNTVLLPQTKFPLRLTSKDLLERDQNVNNSKEFQELYSWQRHNLKDREFVLHDGPPYANGSLHMGHAINKILKDAILRYKIIQGTKVYYVPGWDCHGLPIELKVLSKSKDGSPQVIRENAREFAKDAVENQKKTFKSWGIMGDWENSYTTYSTPYIKNQMNQFLKLYEKNLVFRDVKPVYWSPSSKTALAEAELEYNPNHKSTAVTVRLLVDRLPELSSYIPSFQRIYALIWTTSPWTLPSNQAVCFNPELSYSLVQKPLDPDVYIVATDLVSSLSKTLNCNLNALDIFSGTLLNKGTYYHPVYRDQKLPFLPSNHASASKGTGLVHTAPAHGPEDFVVALNNKISLTCLVDELGCFTSEAGKGLEGKYVLNEGTKEVLNLIKDDILHVEDFSHSYPYDWRTKKPVILRASNQWFVDTGALKNRAIELLDKVRILPEVNSSIYKDNLIGQLQKRPYWCISRQRSWGVPIPVFYDRNGNPIINKKTIGHLTDLLDQHGADFWYMLPLEELIPKDILRDSKLSLAEIKKGNDIFDIWFDSGISWSSVLEGSQIADMYLEGIDQFTGWFQSSLMLSVALRDQAPYKSIYVHGFAVDEKSVKMSKSIGNVIDPHDITHGNDSRKPYGVDTLRWWVACHANQDTMATVSNNVLGASADEVQKIRSVLRFALGALQNYQEIRPHALMLSDQYLLNLLWMFHYEVVEAMRDFHFNRVGTLVINFLTNPVSSLYYTTIKDRLYCDSAHSARRTSAQFVLLHIFHIVSQTIAPIVPHLVQELYEHLPEKDSNSIFTKKRCLSESEWKNDNINDVMELILKIKAGINKEHGANTAGLSANLRLASETYSTFIKIASKESLEIELADILQVSTVSLQENSGQQTEFICETTNSALHACDRCRRHSSRSPNELCDRCSFIVENLSRTSARN